jgi:alpha-L-arabinofuranosidase
MDVIDSLKSTGFQGLFRYPGGCYAPFYRWKIGLLEPDARPPIETPPGYCAAVAGGVNAYTDGMMENGADTQVAPVLTFQLIQTQTRQQIALFRMQGSARTII